MSEILKLGTEMKAIPLREEDRVTQASAAPAPKPIPVHLVEVDTSEYRRSHGKDPRGVGSWAFAAKRNPVPEAILWPTSYTRETGHQTTYAEQRRIAKAHFAALGVYVIFALP